MRRLVKQTDEHMTQPVDYTPEELMAVVISREVRDSETVGVGAVSPIPAAGCILAEQLHAPHLTLIILDCEEYYPFPAGSSELHFMAQRGELDLFFLSGIQFDRHGNFNLHVIGDYNDAVSEDGRRVWIGHAVLYGAPGHSLSRRAHATHLCREGRFRNRCGCHAGKRLS